MPQSALRALDQAYMMGIGQGPAPARAPKTRGQTTADILGAASIPMSPIPIAGDITGLAADAAMYAAYPEERTFGNYALSALGALPMVPGAAAVKAARASSPLEGTLDMSQAARMQRAAEQAYTPDLYHGTAADVSEFNPLQFGGSATKARSAKLGTWLVDNPAVAGGYAKFAAEDVPVQRLLDQSMRAERLGNFDEAERLNALAEDLELGGSLRGAGGQNVMPLKARGNFFEVDADGATMSDLDDNQLTDWAKQAKDKGFDGLKINNFSDNADYGTYIPATHYLIFDPKNIRSVNAAFDPAKRGSANLMAGAAGATMGLSALRNIQRDEEPQPD